VVGTAETGDHFGHALATGDFNHDGIADLAVGLAFEDVGTIVDAGAVTVLYGTAGGLSGTGSQQFTENTTGVVGTAETGDSFGEMLASSDFNNDGVDDVAVGLPMEDVGTLMDAGAVTVLYGTAGGLGGAGSQQFTENTTGVVGTAETGDHFGHALATE